MATSAEPAVVDREPSHRRAIGALLVLAMGATLAAAVLRLPREHAPLPAVARYAMQVALPRWHTTEPVNEVVYGTRGFDTFGETFLLLAAVAGIGAITRGRETRQGFIGEEAAGWRERAGLGTRGETGDRRQGQALRAEGDEEGHGTGPATPDSNRLGTPGPERAAAMTVVVRGAIRVAAPVVATAGLYLVAWGYSPGGGFPGGAVALGVVLLAYVSLGYRRIEPVIRPDVVEPVELAGALAIFGIEALGLVLKGSFSANFLPLAPVGTIRSGGILQAFSGAELIEVGTGLTLAVFGLLAMGHDWSDGQAAPPRQ
jgi:multicomponent Na+:H+ antiporter subunit B